MYGQQQQQQQQQQPQQQPQPTNPGGMPGVQPPVPSGRAGVGAAESVEDMKVVLNCERQHPNDGDVTLPFKTVFIEHGRCTQRGKDYVMA